MLTCVAPYRSDAGAWLPGDVIDDPVLEAHLLVDSPGSFVVGIPDPGPEAELGGRALEAAPAHRMVTREGTRRRTTRKAGA